jgi:hypothetical protein
MEVSGQLHAPAASLPGKEPSVPIGGWVGPITGPDKLSKWKIPSNRRDSNPDYPIFQLLVSRYTDWAIPAVVIFSRNSEIFITLLGNTATMYRFYIIDTSR